MKLWLDAQLPPALAGWMSTTFGVEAVAVRDLGLKDASDRSIFDRAKEAGATILSKDADFVALVGQRGAPPQIVWLTCGNVSNAHFRRLLTRAWPAVSALLATDEPVVELADLDD